MSEKRRGLGRGLGALIPNGATPMTRPAGDRPVDVFFPDRDGDGGAGAAEGGRGLATSVVGAPAPGALSGSPAGPERGGLTVLPGRGGLPASPGRQPGGDLTPSARLSSPSPVTMPPGTVTPLSPVRDRSTGGGSGKGSGAPVDDGAAADGFAAPDGGTASATDTPPSSDAGDGATRAVQGSGSADLVPVPGAYFAELLVTAIRPNPKQPRQVFDEEALAELVQSVKEIGVLQPVVVRRIPDEVDGDGEPQFELIMGERRLRACREAGLERIPSIVRDTQDDALLRDALLENLHRSQLNPLEEAAAYQQLLDDFGCTHEELATRIGRSRPQISNTLRLLRLPPLVQRRVAAAVLSAGHARALLGLEDAAAMERLAQRIVAEGLSVRAVEEIVNLGDGTTPKATRRRPRAGTHTSELDDLASRLGDRLDTRVAIALGRSKGRLSIDFASVDDLNRILTLLSPEVKGAFQES